MIPPVDGVKPSLRTFQKLRLILSTYQDGSGQLRVSEDKLYLVGETLNVQSRLPLVERHRKANQLLMSL